MDDYAFLIKGLLDFYLATLDMDALKWAKELQDTQDRLFWDNNNGGYFYSQENSANVILRLKEDHDGNALKHTFFSLIHVKFMIFFLFT